jgi:hypothetical protein
MRALLAMPLCAALLLPASAAAAETRIFIIASAADGYGVDHCLAAGAACGQAAAASYCRSRDFSEAASYRKVERGEITGAVPAASGGVCRGTACADLIAIECSR